MTRTVLWFRRDLRLADHPALVAAAQAGPVVALFVLDPALRGPAGAPRIAFLYRCLRALDDSLGGRLVVREGDPAEVVPAVAAEVGADEVHVSADFGPYGRARDEAVEQALAVAGRRLVRTGSPYVIDPGTVLKGDGDPFRVFSPFYRAWAGRARVHPVSAPAVRWVTGVASNGLPAEAEVEPEVGAALPPAGEAAALARLDDFLAGPMSSYDIRRDEPAADATTRLSPYLKFGCVHPRQILDRLGRSKAQEKLRSEVAWREFYADVLWHRPESARHSLQPAMADMRLDADALADERFEAWAAGRTGYPLVDAGMRQLLGEAWVHNRVRLVVASFLVKDLHVDWTRGARWFLQHLVDGDLASNNHGWQWVAGTGTDPAPYFRVFNPTTQAKEHDPGGAFIRRWVPELAGLRAPQIFEPWKLAGGPPNGYPAPIVDHGEERAEALARYAEVRRRQG
ncbi:MAG: DNA photolyase family protein [Actinomycetota bacterium]|nr:DNA photolyase family protein [Actinomycetota bacterium]